MLMRDDMLTPWGDSRCSDSIACSIYKMPRGFNFAAMFPGAGAACHGRAQKKDVTIGGWPGLSHPKDSCYFFSGKRVLNHLRESM